MRTIVAVFVAVAGLVVGAPIARADGQVDEEARRHFRVGVGYLQDPEGARYEDAYNEFKVAYATSHSPKVLGNLGLCAMKLERDGEAIDAYGRYLREVPDIDPDERQQIVRDLDMLKASVVSVHITAPPQTVIVDTRIPVRGEPIKNVYGPVNGSIDLRIRPGHHQVQATVGHDALPSWDVVAPAGASLSHEYKAAPAPERPAEPVHASPPIAPWLVTGVGVAALAAGGVLGVVTLGKVRALDDKCPDDTCPAGSGFESDVSSARGFVRATDFLLLGGGIVTVAGVTWLIVSRSGSQHAERAAARHRRWDAGTTCTSTGCLGSARIGF